MCQKCLLKKVCVNGVCFMDGVFQILAFRVFLKRGVWFESVCLKGVVLKRVLRVFPGLFDGV